VPSFRGAGENPVAILGIPLRTALQLHLNIPIEAASPREETVKVTEKRHSEYRIEDTPKNRLTQVQPV
jgi:hypothetical protein